MCVTFHNNTYIILAIYGIKFSLLMHYYKCVIQDVRIVGKSTTKHENVCYNMIRFKKFQMF